MKPRGKTSTNLRQRKTFRRWIGKTGRNRLRTGRNEWKIKPKRKPAKYRFPSLWVIYVEWNISLSNCEITIDILLSIVGNFQDSKEIMMTSDSENDYKYSSTSRAFLTTAHASPCPEGELRCVSGICISVSQLCDKVSYYKGKFPLENRSTCFLGRVLCATF